MEATVSFPAHEHYVLSLAFTADSQTLVSGGMDGLIKQWAVGEWSELATFRGHTGVVHSVAISPDGGLLASGSGDATVRVWSLSTNRLLRIFGCRKKAVRSVAFSADNGWVAAACHGGRAKVWNVHGKLVAQLAAGKHNLTSIALSPDCRLAFLAGEGGEISVWSLPAGHRLAVMNSRSVASDNLHLIRRGRVLLSLGLEKDVVAWDTATRQRIRAYPMARMDICTMAVSPDEALVGIGLPQMVHVRTLDDMELQAELSIPAPRVAAIAFSPDGKWLAVGASEGKLYLWRLRLWT